MKVVHLSTNPSGGATLACLRLHRALLAANVESDILLLHGKENRDERISVFQSSLAADELEKLQKQDKQKRYRQAWQVRLKGKPKELFSFPDSPWKIETHPLVRDADIIHLHWVARMIDVPRFFASVQKPIVWTLHDAWPFTGGFHYENYFDVKPFRKLAEKNKQVLREAYRGKKISVVAPSEYLLDAAKTSDMFGSNFFRVIRNSVPAEIFTPSADRHKLRRDLNFETSLQYWFFAGEELDYYRKGADLLLGAFSQWKNDRVRLVVTGEKGKLEIPADDRVRFTGRIDGEKKMAELLNACDAVIHPSREDNLPNIIVESLCCGTPVLATPVGGVPEMIRTGENGLLTNAVNENSLRTGFDQLFKTSFDRAKISVEAKKIYAPGLQAEKYLEVYNQCRSGGES